MLIKTKLCLALFPPALLLSSLNIPSGGKYNLQKTSGIYFKTIIFVTSKYLLGFEHIIPNKHESTNRTKPSKLNWILSNVQQMHKCSICRIPLFIILKKLLKKYQDCAWSVWKAENSTLLQAVLKIYFVIIHFGKYFVTGCPKDVLWKNVVWKILWCRLS